MVLDIKDDAVRAVIEAMVARADVFGQNLAPGAAALVARFPRLIAVDIVGNGQDMAARDMWAHDVLI